MNVFSSEGTVPVFKKSRCVPGCYGSLDGAPSCKPKGSPVGFPVRTHAWQEKICGACGEDAVTDGMCQKWIVKFCPRGRQTRCSGEPSTPGAH